MKFTQVNPHHLKSFCQHQIYIAVVVKQTCFECAETNLPVSSFNCLNTPNSLDNTLKWWNYLHTTSHMGTFLHYVKNEYVGHWVWLKTPPCSSVNANATAETTDNRSVITQNCQHDSYLEMGEQGVHPLHPFSVVRKRQDMLHFYIIWRDTQQNVFHIRLLVRQLNRLALLSIIYFMITYCA